MRALSFTVVCWLGLSSALAAGGETSVGKKMYRDGMRPTGEPLTAIVAGDVQIRGTQFSCESCHGRSGMGALEGNYVVPAIAGRILYEPLPQPARPAYDPTTLARVLRDGITASGRMLNEVMPRYDLSDDEVAALGRYLAVLSSGEPPGVDAKTLRLATIVAGAVDTDAREAYLDILDRFVQDKNRQTRLESERPDRGSTPASRLPPVFREWQLEVWVLMGPADTWEQQLDALYAGAPVFALLGGLSNGSWGPIGRFCERQEIPCLFPATDRPDAGAEDFYTYHFSQGLGLEAALIADELQLGQTRNVVQVYCGDASASAAADLRALLEARTFDVVDVPLEDCSRPLRAEDLDVVPAQVTSTAAVLWLDREGLGSEALVLPVDRVFVSSTLLDGDLDGPLPSARETAVAVHPFRLPNKVDPGYRRLLLWARPRQIELTHPRLQSRAFFACLAANDAILHIERFIIRDYVLDMLDHAQGLEAYLPIYPRPTLGPSQRFLTKGGYSIPITGGQPDFAAAVWHSP